VRANQIAQPGVSIGDLNAMTLFAFFEEREQPAQNRRQVLLDRGWDDPAEADPRLHALHALVERCQRDNGLGPHLFEHLLQLALGIRGVETDDDGADFPGTELGDQELRTVGQQQCYPVALANAEVP